MSLTPEQAEMYRAFHEEFTPGGCWRCGWDARTFRWRDWMLNRFEAAHILRGCNRVHDRRVLVFLCNGCHRLEHGERVKPAGMNCYLPGITLANMLWLKREYDPEFYDLEFLRQTSIRKDLPEPAEPEYWEENT